MARAAAGVLVAAALLAVGACGGSTATRTTTVTVAETTPTGDALSPPRERVEFGHIRSLRRAGDGWQLTFDPAWFLSGETANKAAAEDGVVSPGEPVPNDNYRVEEGHRLLTYRVADDARVSVITRHGDPAQLGATPISVAELARVVAGTSTVKLFEPLDSGVWLTTDIDTVRAIQQQYQP
ncbi:MAG: hypothetical protein ACM33B_03320 [Pseudomonadota bacterium]